MFSKPKCGWSKFSVNEYSAPVSYVTDVPIDVLDLLITYKTNYCGSMRFDCEGYEFIIILTPYNIYIIEEKDESTLIQVDSISSNEFVKIALKDIKDYKDDWVVFLSDSDINYELDKKLIDDKIAELEKILKEEERDET